MTAEHFETSAADLAALDLAAIAAERGMWMPGYARRVPPRRPAGHEPRAARWSHAFSEPVGIVTCDYLAVQTGSEDHDAVRRLHELAGGDGPHAPEAWEMLRFVDDAGLVNTIHLAYWTDPTAHARWLDDSPLARWYADLDASAIDFGAWHEVIAEPADRLETVCSDEHLELGIARSPRVGRIRVTVNGYFGAARDRMPLSAIDELEAEDAAPLPRREIASAGRRLRAEIGHNASVIRSGQYWRQAEGEQLDDYENELQPKLMAGMRHLAQHADDEGTLSLRVMTSIDPVTGEPGRETSVLGHFHSLGHLERWAEGHATHHAIYGHAIEQSRRYGAERTVVTWHEVFAVSARGFFEYVNCHPGTGILPRARRVMETA